VVTNRMVLNFGSSIKANILWPRFLSNACKRKGKVEKHLQYFVSCIPQVFSTHDWRNPP
jgi:hypothetical protein